MNPKRLENQLDLNKNRPTHSVLQRLHTHEWGHPEIEYYCSIYEDLQLLILLCGDKFMPGKETACQFLQMASKNEPAKIKQMLRAIFNRPQTCMSVNWTVDWKPLRSRPNPSCWGSPRLSRSLQIAVGWKVFGIFYIGVEKLHLI